MEDARNELEQELEKAQTEYITARQKAPVLFQGDGSSNVYIEKDKGPLRLCCKHLIRPATYSWVYVERWDISYLCIDAVHFACAFAECD